MFLHTYVTFIAVASRNFCVYHLIMLKKFHVFNFCGVKEPKKLSNLANFPNYGTTYLLICTNRQ